MRESSPDLTGVPAAVELLGRLIAFPTVSSTANRMLIEDIAAWLRERGVGATIVDAAEDGKAGLIASIGPSVPGGIVLSGHTDVVPVEGQQWSSDPFTLVERDGRLFGRGSADMKGFIATVLAAVPGFVAAPLRRPIHIALSWDEEIGCLGAPRLIKALLAAVPPPALVVVGEPTGMQPADRHRGITTFTTTIDGRGGHSSAPYRGVSAIGLAARLIGELERIAAAWADATPAGQDDVPGCATLNVGRINGGTAINMIAERCCLEWECRAEADSQIETLLARLKTFSARELLEPLAARAPEAAIRTERKIIVPPFRAATDSPAVALALRLSGANACKAAPFATEAGLFELAAIPAVILGPGWPSEAHRPDEFVDRDQLASCMVLMRRIAQWAS